MGFDGGVTFIADEFSHLFLTVSGIIYGYSAYSQVGDAVTVHVSKGVVGRILIGMIPTGWTGENERLETEFRRAFVVSAKQKHSSRWYGPAFVSVDDIVANVFWFITSAIIGGDDFGEDSLSGPKVFQGVCPCQKGGIIERDDEIFTPFFFVLNGFVE